MVFYTSAGRLPALLVGSTGHKKKKERPLNCYICAQKGTQTPAVAVCLACGMGVCMDHLVREELPIEDIVDWGLGKEKVTYPKTLPRILCIWCAEALAQRKKA
jgi:hypothetical protein